MGGMTALILAVPLAAFFSAAALPRGRPAFLGIAGALAIGVAVRAALVPAGGEAGLVALLLTLGLVGLAMAGAAQGLRLLLPGAGPLARAGYPAILLAVLAVAPLLARHLLT